MTPRQLILPLIAAVALAACVSGAPATPAATSGSFPSGRGLVPPVATIEPDISSSPELSAPPASAIAPHGSGVAPAGSAIASGGMAIGVPPRSGVPHASSIAPQPSPPAGTPPPVPTVTQPPVAFRTGVLGRALLGPTCPVVSNPPDPRCADRPLAGVLMTVRNGAGATVASGTTDTQGFFAIELPPGDFVLVPPPIPNAMHSAAPIPFTVSAAGPPSPVIVSYDTGIR